MISLSYLFINILRATESKQKGQRQNFLRVQDYQFNNNIKSVQNGVADFNYFLVQKVNRFIKKAINIS